MVVKAIMLLAVALLISALLVPTEAQVTPPLTSSGLNTQVSAPTPVTGGKTQYDITGGTRPNSGPNLFHSFGKFDVPTNNIANFLNDTNTPTTNILSRVTGGTPSNIFGTIQTTGFPGAHLFLMNPAGVVFGPTAQLNVEGSFHVTTADYLRMTDGAKFHVDPVQPSVLSVAPVAAFGFTAAKPVAITVQGSTLEVPTQQGLSIVGGDFTLTGGTLRAFGGRIQIASVASSGEVIPSGAGQPLALDVSSFTRLGSVTESASSNLSVSAPTTTSTIGAGTVLIRANQLTVASSGINATTAVTNGASVGIDLNVTEKILLTGSTAQTAANGAGRAGDIRIQTDTLQVDGAGILGRALSGTGDGGAIDVNARLVDLRNGFGIQTFTNAGGRAGNITLRADRLEIRDGANIFSGGLGTGSGGIIDVAVKELFGSATNLASVQNCAQCNTGINAQAGFGSRGGSVRVHADNIQLFDGAVILSQLFSIGPGANMEVTAKDILLSGTVTVTGSSGPVTHFATIGSTLSGTFATGTGGNVTVNAENIELTNNGRIFSSLIFSAPGNAGNTAVNTGTLNIHDRGGVFATSFLGTGNSGDIDITAKEITISGVRNSLDPGGVADFTGLSASTLSGRGGTLRVTTDDLFVRDKGIIASTTFGTGNSGNIQIAAKNVSVTDAGQMTAVTGGSGRGGNIDIIADNVAVTGQALVPGALDAGAAVITSRSQAGGDAGSITIVAKQLDVSNGGAINNDALAAGKGGNIQIQAGQMQVENLASVSAGTFGKGNAGNISLSGDSLIVTSGGRVEAGTSAQGAGGTINITTTGDVTISGVSADGQTRSGIFAKTQTSGSGSGGGSGGGGSGGGSGGGGAVPSTIPGNAGDINITAKNLLLDLAGPGR